MVFFFNCILQRVVEQMTLVIDFYTVQGTKLTIVDCTQVL